jgi:hypothetical protein
MARVEIARTGMIEAASGIRGFRLLRPSGSAFKGFVRDQYTTLPDLADRPLHMWLDLEWRCTDFHAAFTGGRTATRVRSIVHDIFETFESGSIQQVIYQMGTKILAEVPEIAEVPDDGARRVFDDRFGAELTQCRRLEQHPSGAEVPQHLVGDGAAPRGQLLDGDGGAEGYAAAVTRDQARILFDTAREMVRRSPEIRRRYGVEALANAIWQEPTSSNFRPISSDAKALDGLNVQVAVCDEIASHKTSEVYDVLLTAMGKRSNPLLLAISTATGNNSGVGKQLWDYAVRVLEDTQQRDLGFCRQIPDFVEEDRATVG